MFAFLMFAALTTADRQVGVTFRSDQSVEALRACVTKYWSKRTLRVSERPYDGNIALAASFAKWMHPLNESKPFWVVQIEEDDGKRRISVGYNPPTDERNAEKQLRRLISACSPDAVENPKASTP